MLSPYHGESPCALGKAAVPAGRDFYPMPERVHPASPTATDLFKNLTEKTGTHTLLYEQKKAKLNNRHSFCRFCTHAIWWAPQRQSNETAPRSGTTCLHNEVIKCIYRQPLNCRSKSWGTPLSPSGSGRHKYSLGFASLLQTEPRKKQCRHRRHGSSSATQAFITFGNSLCFYIHCPFQRIEIVNKSKQKQCFVGVQVHSTIGL